MVLGIPHLVLPSRNLTIFALSRMLKVLSWSTAIRISRQRSDGASTHQRVVDWGQRYAVCLNENKTNLIDWTGSDAMLMRLATDAFEKADWPTKVETGRYTFPLGTGVRSVAES